MSTTTHTDDGHHLYRLFDAVGELLYVGITNNVKRRLQAHAERQPWWSEVARHTFTSLPDREMLEAAEAIAIRYETPRYNKRDRGWLPRLVCSGCRRQITGPLSTVSGHQGVATWRSGTTYDSDGMPTRDGVVYACNWDHAALALGVRSICWRPLGMFLAQEEAIARRHPVYTP